MSADQPSQDHPERCGHPRCWAALSGGCLESLGVDPDQRLPDHPESLITNQPHHDCPECGGFCALYEAMNRKTCDVCGGTGVARV